MYVFIITISALGWCGGANNKVVCLINTCLVKSDFKLSIKGL